MPVSSKSGYYHASRNINSVIMKAKWKKEYKMTLSLEENKTKELIKQAILELIEEREDLIYDLFAEIIEDTLLVTAIREGENSQTVSRAEIMGILRGEA
jgi:hypothetical protein